MNEEILNKLLSIGEKKEFNPGDEVFPENSISEELCFVINGKVGVERSIGDNRYICTFIIPEGQFFGEMAIFQAGNRLAKIKAIESSEILIIKRERFLNFINEQKEEGLKTFLYILESIFDRMKHTNREMSCFFQLTSLLSEIQDVNTFILSVGKMITDSLCLDAFAAYEFNSTTSSFNILSEVGVATEKMKSVFLEYIDLAEESDLERFGIMDLKDSLIMPIIAIGGLKGIVLLFKKEMFNDNEKLFLKALHTQISSLLESVFYKRDQKDQEKLKQVKFLM